MKKLNNIDYVEFYAKKLKHNKGIFKQQQMLIESQLKGSASLFSSMFDSGNFKENARKYLKRVGLIRK